VDPAYKERVLNSKGQCPTPIDPDGAEAHKKCLDKLAELTAPRWNADGLALAGATSEAFSNGALSRGNWADTAVWLTGSYGIDVSARFGLQLSAALEFRHVDVSSTNIGGGGVRVRGGSASIRGSLESSYATDNPEDPNNRRGKLLVGLDVKLTKGTWLNTNIGGVYDFSGSPLGVFSLASLKYAFASDPAVSGP
jgi:hypothetical protein